MGIKTNAPAFDPDSVNRVLVEIGSKVCRHIYHSVRNQSIAERAAVAEECQEDTIFQIDRDVEFIILPEIERHARELGGVVLAAEGIGESGVTVLPEGLAEEDAAVRILMDPIDGTRGIMYDKRSAFFLAGAAPNQAEPLTLQDIEAAVMVELPTSRSHLYDVLWAVRGRGAARLTRDLESATEYPGKLSPSQSKTILGGYGQISRFFPPGKDVLAQIEEELTETLFPDPPAGKAILFNDQYISSGGQLYEMLLGHDRFVADLRACLYRRRKAEGKWVGMTCHPYDVCAHLIGTEAGLIITDAEGGPMNYPMGVHGDADWIAYANPAIRQEVEPVLLEILRRYQLI